MSQIDKVIAGRYVLKSLIGQGGMADVYKAEDTILKRTVAVKIMRSSLTGDPVYVTRFHREASAAAALSHKNIVEIYDVGDENDEYYIVMEYVPGQTLKELIHKRGAVHYVEAVDIMKQVVAATAKAHSMGIVHRDLKPQNIMVTDSGVVKIGDFGIASIQSLSQVTQTDTIMGSLHYLAPEIARGEKATAQSDIYALGIVFYELLRGEVPFNGESPVNIALKHMRDEIPSVKEFNPSIPQSVENIIIKATAKNVNDRYQTANDVLEDLNTCLSRLDEEKLVFEYVDKEEEKTIVAKDEDYFTSDHQLVDKEEDKKLDRKKVMMIAGGVIAGIVIIGLLIYFLFFSAAKTFEMPDVTGIDIEEAITTLEEDYELIVDEDDITYEPSDDQEEGIVISTDPTATTAVKKGDNVSIVVSSGQYIVIEDYTGKDYDEVYDALTELGFTVKKNEITSDEDKGTIIEQSIVEGEKIDPNATDKTITLTVSKGYSATVPNVYGQNITKAQQVLEEAGFTVKLEVKDPPTDADSIRSMTTYVVVEQSIEAFTTVYKKGTEITLYYYTTIPDIEEEEEETTTNNDTETTTENENNDTETNNNTETNNSEEEETD
ncbi:MAG: Stk1 family PASTA domain-containing Ser/Thr kinase [Erysipelotrichaceae bacterium]|nr:Stk1 family PASTA domain-containing Ser/Thr kinase [Erysipelotrichaceae bacterium]